MKTMAEVLAAHHISVGNEGGWYCSNFECGSFASSQEATKHQADMLTAAGFGLVKEAQARAYDKGYTLGRKDGSDWRIRLGGVQGIDRRNPYRTATVPDGEL